jgi:UDP-N-acetylglucosamine-lysosomal-enzyme
MNSLQEKFKEDFEITSSNRFRSRNDIQFAFSYYNFIQSELRDFDAEKIFTDLDLNFNDCLDENELLVMNLKLNSTALSKVKKTKMEDKINHKTKKYLLECKINKSKNIDESGENELK